jgi:hypothetical protein
LNNIPAYKTELVYAKNRVIQYLFESEGHRSIIKVIEYKPLEKKDGKTVYNLGFGDYNEENGNILDDVISNNGDMRQVFSTVINTVPKFFKENPNAGIWIQGSDSADDYKKLCEINCRKKCGCFCKNFNRRLRAYQYYVDKNFEALTKEYTFFGFDDSETPDLDQYIPRNEYTGILLFKKK